MPPKITSKNLHYDDSTPPFLAALRAQASGARGPDPLLAAQRRSAKKRSSSEEAEDAPLVVDEDGNVVGDHEVDKDGVVKDLQDHGPEGSTAAPAAETVKESNSKASIGGRKRKVGKVIGDSADQPADKDAAGTGGKGDAKEGAKDRKPKKKSKKIKLSFDDDEG
ncbi:hypothetical protein QQX98_001051 [Neonectria punicea]|uniref:DUF4604 domain-containing protein n=1 Tax=Neonectria punicea TaxID=979145 RepID=A0ABR1HQS6_9HYPO